MRSRCNYCHGVNPELALPPGLEYCGCGDNPSYYRFARITVTVEHTWLTDGGEYPDTEEGWKELETQLKEQISRMKFAGGVKVEFEEWEGDPEEVE